MKKILITLFVLCSVVIAGDVVTFTNTINKNGLSESVSTTFDAIKIFEYNDVYSQGAEQSINIPFQTIRALQISVDNSAVVRINWKYRSDTISFYLNRGDFIALAMDTLKSDTIKYIGIKTDFQKVNAKFRIYR